MLTFLEYDMHALHVSEAMPSACRSISRVRCWLHVNGLGNADHTYTLTGQKRKHTYAHTASCCERLCLPHLGGAVAAVCLHYHWSVVHNVGNWGEDAVHTLGHVAIILLLCAYAAMTALLATTVLLAMLVQKVHKHCTQCW